MIDVILSQLIANQDYFGRVWPYLDESYFESGPPKILFKSIKKHVEDYNGIPSKVALNIAISNSKITENEMKGCVELLSSLKDEKENCDWLIPETEKYVQKVAVYNATTKIIEIQANADQPPEKRKKGIPDVGAIPEIMRDAISICFDSSVGHNWMDDYETRWLSYKNKTKKIPFKLNILNKITKGGAENATLNILLAGSNVGKSLGLCSLAADYLQIGKNVLYISMEMGEEVCAKRIDANLLDVTLDSIDEGHVTYQEYKSKMERWRQSNVLGQLYIKQYATGGANANTFRALINELKLKKGFVPDVIIVDYLGICGSCRIKQYTENSYTLVKAIAEELRALAFDTNTCIWSAAQTTRSGWDASDISMGDVAESAGLVHTADFILAVIETDELAKLGQQMLKQIKSRYGDKNINNKFNLIVKKGNQRWVELDGEVAPKIPELGTNFIMPTNLKPSINNVVEPAKTIVENEPNQTNEIHKINAPNADDLENFIADFKF